MAERSRRGVRRQISDTPDEVSEQSASESEQDWDSRRAEPSRKASKNDKLREVMRANEVDALQDVLGGGKVIDGPRSRRSLAPRASARGANRPRYVEYGESDLDEDDEEDEEEEEEEVDDEEMNDFDEIGAEAEGGTDDEDMDMEDVGTTPSRRQLQTKQPKITLKPPHPAATTAPISSSKPGPRPKVAIKPPPDALPFKSVEEQEMEDAEEEEEEEDDGEEGSSDLSEDEDATNLNEDMEGDEMMGEEDAEGEDEELDDDDDSEGDSDDENSASNMGTPDPNKLTKRQRGRPEDQTTLLALDMAPQQRKFFTDEEKAMKKDEHARKRKELTKRKINEEKTAALNRLLKPQVSKARGAAPKPETLAAAAAAAANNEHELVENADPLYVRWINNKDGTRFGVPEEWLGKNVGRLFGPPLPPKNNILVQEVE